MTTTKSADGGAITQLDEDDSFDLLQLVKKHTLLTEDEAKLCFDVMNGECAKETRTAREVQLEVIEKVITPEFVARANAKIDKSYTADDYSFVLLGAYVMAARELVKTYLSNLGGSPQHRIVNGVAEDETGNIVHYV